MKRSRMASLNLSPFVGADGSTIRPNRAGLINPVTNIPIFWGPTSVNPTRRMVLVEKITDDERVKCRSIPAASYRTPTGLAFGARGGWLSLRTLRAGRRPMLAVDILNHEDMTRYGLNKIPLAWCRENVDTFPDKARGKEYADVHTLTDAWITLAGIRLQKELNAGTKQMFASEDIVVAAEKEAGTSVEVDLFAELSVIVTREVRRLIPEIAAAVLDAITAPSQPVNGTVDVARHN